jgi:hypothetical protein
MTEVDKFQDYSYVYTVTRQPIPGTMVHWFENAFVARSCPRISIKLNSIPLVQAYGFLKIFGVFSPEWVA